MSKKADIQTSKHGTQSVDPIEVIQSEQGWSEIDAIHKANLAAPPAPPADEELLGEAQGSVSSESDRPPRPALAENGFARRICVYLHTPAEVAIRAAIAAVEKVGAHVWLTDAVILLGRAADKVADFVELPSSQATASAPPLSTNVAATVPSQPSSDSSGEGAAVVAQPAVDNMYCPFCDSGLVWTEKEVDAICDLSARLELSAARVIKQALRVFQLQTLGEPDLFKAIPESVGAAGVVGDEAIATEMANAIAGHYCSAGPEHMAMRVTVFNVAHRILKSRTAADSSGEGAAVVAQPAGSEEYRFPSYAQGSAAILSAKRGVEAERQRIREQVAAVPSSEPWPTRMNIAPNEDGTPVERARNVSEYRADVLALLDEGEK